MSFPSWVTISNLGSYSQDYSFDLNPITLSFSATSGSTISLLNGTIPFGLTWQRINNNVIISGVVSPTTSIINGQFTFRIKQTDGYIADRTFSIVLTPLPVSPRWNEQPTFLGYQSNVGISTYQLSAVPPEFEYVEYTLQSPVTGATLDLTTGLLSYNASFILVNSTTDFTVRATATSSATYSDIDLHVDVVISPLSPKWITSSGSIGTFSSQDFISFNLIATDVTGLDVTYSLLSSSSGFTLNVSPSGLLYGELSVEGIYTFTVEAISGNGITTRTFSITIVLSDIDSLLIWTSDSDLGSINEGEFIELLVSADSQRNSSIVYSVTGGMLPPHLMLEKTAGKIIGFCEYHAISKIYYFNITASDGYQSIIRQFSIIVNKLYGDQFMGIHIPVIGQMRDLWASDASNVKVREPGTSTVYGLSNIIDPPFMNVINGLVTGYDTPTELINLAKPWLHNLDLQYGITDNSYILTSNLSTIYREIVDSQLGTNVTVYSSSVYNTNVTTNGIVYPISIDNIRQAFINNYTFINGGSGTGSVLSPALDWTNGSISNIQVIQTGSGYISKPDIKISGSGTGATATVILGLVGITIIDTGQGWQINDEIEVQGNIFTTPAILKVTATGTNGSVADVSIIDPGDYLQISSANKITINNGSAFFEFAPVWGITSVDMLSNGIGYECGVNIETTGGELLPFWQEIYFPAIEIGRMPVGIAPDTAFVLNYEQSTLWGTAWKPSYVVLQWQGIKWTGSTTFDTDLTTFDGNTTQFEETEDARLTVFDDNFQIFEQGSTTFDYTDPLEYDLFRLWGGTLIDSGTTIFDMYSTIFDALGPKRHSNTMVRRWISMQHKIYSGNNAVW